jgi:hypothetical protein
MKDHFLVDPTRRKPGAAPADAWSDLGLGDDELAALRRQGFVSQEVRRANKTVYKLRFRMGGRQRVKCLGADPLRAAAIAQALAELQQKRRTTLKLRRLQRDAARAIRRTKIQLEPHLIERGFRFHGLAIRRTRRSRLTCPASE